MLRDSTLPAYIHDWAASLESEAEGLREERDEFEADAKQRERRRGLHGLRARRFECLGSALR
jgi:hypothetical protein